MTRHGRAEKRIPLYDLKLSTTTLRQVVKTLKSGWLTTGPKVRQFEQEVASYLGVRYSAAVNSATAGLVLSLQTVGAGHGKEVITSPFTFVATVEAIVRCGAIPILADIIPETLTIDPDEVARKLSKRTACVMPVDIAGHPSDYRRLRAVCSEGPIPLIADASHAFGASVKGKSVSRLADAAVYSFHSTKNLTCGEGGMVVSRYKPFVDKIRLLSLHGLTAGTHERRLKRQWAYDVVDLGHKANLSDVQASIGLGELVDFEKKQRKRTAIADRYIRNLTSLDQFVGLPQTASGVRHGWHLFIVLLRLSRLKIDRNRFIALMARRGIECGVHYQPIFTLSFYRQLGLTERYFPNTVYVGRRVVSLPLYPGLKLSQVDTICQAISDIVKRHSR